MKALHKPGKRILWAFIGGLFLPGSPAWGYNPYFPPYTYLSAKNAGMGGVFSPLTGNPEGIFENPASIACARRRFSYSHSLRHFPGKIKNLDQLDADSVASVSHFGFLTVGWGFTVAGELGYDYLTRNDSAFPEEKIEGREEVWGRAYGTCWLSVGQSVRQFRYLLHKLDSAVEERHGATLLTGKVFHPLPWLSFSFSQEKGSAFSKPSGNTENQRGGSVSFLGPPHLILQKRGRQNVSIRLFPWWLWSTAREERTYSFPGSKSATGVETFQGLEIQIFGLMWRAGRWNEHPANGFSLPWGRGSLDYAEIKDVLPDITGAPLPYFRDVHMGGFTLK